MHRLFPALFFLVFAVPPNTPKEPTPPPYVLCLGHKDCFYCHKWEREVLLPLYRAGWNSTHIAYSELPPEKPNVPFVPLYLRFVDGKPTSFVNSVMTMEQTVEFYYNGKVTK